MKSEDETLLHIVTFSNIKLNHLFVFVICSTFKLRIFWLLWMKFDIANDLEQLMVVWACKLTRLVKIWVLDRSICSSLDFNSWIKYLRLKITLKQIYVRRVSYKNSYIPSIFYSTLQYFICIITAKLESCLSFFQCSAMIHTENVNYFFFALMNEWLIFVWINTIVNILMHCQKVCSIFQLLEIK